MTFDLRSRQLPVCPWPEDVLLWFLVGFVVVVWAIKVSFAFGAKFDDHSLTEVAVIDVISWCIHRDLHAIVEMRCSYPLRESRQKSFD
jgi:hypothetical protein